METPIIQEGFVESEAVKLHYIQWGNTGPVFVLICGLGDTPYIFQELAEAWCSDFRVIGYSRREHGKSVSKIPKYDNETLVSDLKLLLDELEIDKASLLGWSLGGNEITAFAARYPQRVDKLVYFESGYDLSDQEFKSLLNGLPEFLLPGPAEMKSLEAYKKWYHDFWFGDIPWNAVLENNVMASLHLNPDGSITTIPDNTVSKAILAEGMNYHREYKKVQAPSLVIYAKPFFHPPRQSAEIVKAYDDFEKNLVAPWRLASMERVRSELKNATVVEVKDGTHASFLFLNRDSLVKTIKAFLK